ncbi:unnamed protein product [Cuscuta epithymum]|uniref:CCHC-type domain-containing protein n=1 Tax=Cuscuta epithymum TaxID=186058 RepID=A0AAV0CS72_9ASTE|nr:unnamed protein product [Cuscuta epithymum]
MRIRVCIDLGKPLKRRLVLQKDEGVTFRVRFCYEKLPSFCFLCGIIGHAESHCPRKRRGYEVTGERPFGPWLRAAKGAKQWKENKWLVPIGRGISSDSKITGGNREESMCLGTVEGGLSSHERGSFEQKRRRVEDSTEHQSGEEMEIVYTGGGGGGELLTCSSPGRTLRVTGPHLWGLNKAESQEDYLFLLFFILLCSCCFYFCLVL